MPILVNPSSSVPTARAARMLVSRGSEKKLPAGHASARITAAVTVLRSALIVKPVS